MYTIPLHLTALAADRDRALALVRSATGLPPLAAHSVVLTTDATATAVLRAAGIPPEDARPILATLWPLAPRPAEPRPGSPPASRTTPGRASSSSSATSASASTSSPRPPADADRRADPHRHPALPAARHRSRRPLAVQPPPLPARPGLRRPTADARRRRGHPVADPAAAVRPDRLSRRPRGATARLVLRSRCGTVAGGSNVRSKGESAVVPEPTSSEPTIIVREPDLPRIAAATRAILGELARPGRPGSGTPNTWPRRWPAGR